MPRRKLHPTARVGKKTTMDVSPGYADFIRWKCKEFNRPLADYLRSLLHIGMIQTLEKDGYTPESIKLFMTNVRVNDVFDLRVLVKKEDTPAEEAEEPLNPLVSSLLGFDGYTQESIRRFLDNARTNDVFDMQLLLRSGLLEKQQPPPEVQPPPPELPGKPPD